MASAIARWGSDPLPDPPPFRGGRRDGLEQRRRQSALEIERVRPGHQDMAVALTPLDQKIAARQAHAHLAPGELAPRGRDRRSAGGRAASPRQPGAALPGADFQRVRRHDLHQRDIGALRKQRMMLEHRPEPSEIIRLDIIDEEQAMRVADIDRRRRMQHRRVDRTDLQLDPPCVVERLGEGNLVPCQAAARPCRR